MIETNVNGRWPLLLPEHRAVRPEWPWWEATRLAAMRHFIKPADLVYDIGAEEGDFPGLFASWGANVVLVEPNPKVWPNIRAIFEANALTDRMRGWYVGFAGDECRTILDWDLEHTANPEGPWPVCAHGPIIGDHGFLVIPERPDVSITTVDWLAEHFGLPDVITIDVEGAELTVLRGASRVLRDNRPLVFVSVHIDLPWIDEKYPGDTGENLAVFMNEHGYEGVYLTTDHEAHWLYVPNERMWPR